MSGNENGSGVTPGLRALRDFIALTLCTSFHADVPAEDVAREVFPLERTAWINSAEAVLETAQGRAAVDTLWQEGHDQGFRNGQLALAEQMTAIVLGTETGTGG